MGKVFVVRGGDDGGWEVLRFGWVGRLLGDGINLKRCRMWILVIGGWEMEFILNLGIFFMLVVS